MWASRKCCLWMEGSSTSCCEPWSPESKTSVCFHRKDITTPPPPPPPPPSLPKGQSRPCLGHLFAPSPAACWLQPPLSTVSLGVGVGGRLTVVALGLGGLAFPFLPVLFSFLISDLSFCSLIGKTKRDQARLVLRACQDAHTLARTRTP